MAKWIKTGKSVSTKGTTITYECAELPEIRIESRMVHIPHANGEGTWDHTSYFVLLDNGGYAEKWTLKEAKEYAEELGKEADDE